MKFFFATTILGLSTSFQHIVAQKDSSELTINDFVETLYCTTEWRCGDKSWGGGGVTSFEDLPFTEDELKEKLLEIDPKYDGFAIEDLKDDPEVQEMITQSFEKLNGGGCKVYGSCLYKGSDSRQYLCEEYGSSTTYHKCCCQTQDIVHRFFDSVMDLIDETFGPGWDGRRRSLSSAATPMVPPIIPNHENTEVVNEEVGIYVLPGFMEDQEVDKLVDFVDKYGENYGLYEECSSKANKGLEDSKVCMKLSPEKALTKEDELYLANIMHKIKSAWIKDESVEHNVMKDYFDVQRVTGESKGMKEHADLLNVGKNKNAYPVTFALYLSDSEVGVEFPHADKAVISPKKGTAATWHNSYIDGSMNDKATHFVQDKVAGSPDRYIIVYQFTVPYSEEVTTK